VPTLVLGVHSTTPVSLIDNAIAAGYPRYAMNITLVSDASAPMMLLAVVYLSSILFGYHLMSVTRLSNGPLTVPSVKNWSNESVAPFGSVSREHTPPTISPVTLVKDTAEGKMLMQAAKQRCLEATAFVVPNPGVLVVVYEMVVDVAEVAPPEPITNPEAGW
jgi:hypothetical protein